MPFSDIVALISLPAAILGVVAAVVALRLTVLSHLHYSLLYSWTRDVPRELKKAKTRVWILQTWIPGLRTDVDDWRHALKTNPDVDFRVLLLDPDLVQNRLTGRQDRDVADVGETDTSVKQIVALMSEFNVNPRQELDRVQARFYSVLPFGPVYILDDTIYWGIYTAHQDSLNLPAFRQSARSGLGAVILASFERVWSLGEPSSGNSKLFPEGTSEVGSEAVSAAVVHINEEAALQVALSNFVGVMRSVNDLSSAEIRGFLAVVRAATSDVEQAGVVVGQLEIPINEEGHLQASRLAEKFGRFDEDPLIWSSPLRSARETAEGAFRWSSSDIETNDQLRDRSMGKTQGRSWPTDIPIQPVYEGPWIYGRTLAKEERLVDVLMRVAPLLQRAIDEVRKGNNVVLFTHEAVVAAVAFLLGEKPSGERVGPGEVVFYAEVVPE